MAAQLPTCSSAVRAKVGRAACRRPGAPSPSSSSWPLSHTPLAADQPAQLQLQLQLPPPPLPRRAPAHACGAGRMACRGVGRGQLAVVLSTGDIVEVEELKGIRVVPDPEHPQARPRVEYLVKWKDGSPDTWEPAANLADNLLRDFEQSWWGAVKKGDEEVLNKMMEGGGKVLARTIDENRRSALHFAAALGKPDLVRALVAQGADVDLGDKDGYTPLHMAAGYLHTSTVTALIQAGADPEQEDAAGRSPMGLMESLKERIPANNSALVGRRIALEEVIKVLTDNLYEDVEPAAVLDSRPVEGDGGGREFLVRWQDGREDTWLAEKYMSAEVVEDYDSGLEYAHAECVLGVKVRGDSRTYRVRWQDGYPDSWEPEEHVSPDLIKLFEQQQALLGGEEAGQRSSGDGSVAAAAAAAGQQQEQQQRRQGGGQGEAALQEAAVV